MTGKLLMVQGTASHVGKSLIAAALCRIFRRTGYTVAPFKAQNMSLNSFVTPDGGEIGRSQAVQAEAAGVLSSVDMNPVLLKPEADSRSQVILLGRPYVTIGAAEYYGLKSRLWPEVVAALERLRRQYQVVIIEGAGGAAEINLAKDEIVNMRVARHAQAPVLLIGDIDRGGVFASLVGTMELLEPDDRALVKAMLINKFRGDVALLEPGLDFLKERTGVPIAGVVPWFNDIRVAEEDSLGLKRSQGGTSSEEIDIAVIRMPHLSNFDDFDPFINDTGVSLRYVASVDQLGNPDVVILPGSKTTISDLDWLRERGLAEGIRERYQQGAFVIGICAGYQMLGQKIFDPNRVESPVSEADGLGLLPVTTVFSDHKETHQVEGEVLDGTGLLAGARGIRFEGYEIHMGTSQGPSSLVPFSLTRHDTSQEPRTEGSLDGEGRVLGTFVHGLFDSTALRQAILRNVALARGKVVPEKGQDLTKDTEYDKLATLVQNNLDMDLIYRIVGLDTGAK